ncbi:hypothetical protein BI364_06990 [Acidihalobacter yilgarnensis]|uniref:Conjugal transfer protein TrbJ n=2 Tax=Acidihalobacter yilgarnensis TaxID=2819280 RepID=A0A1D8IMP3_9GAMM|nr:hypothetical protein BI364_06990 [Acidihalobacter yilgarnensis]
MVGLAVLVGTQGIAHAAASGSTVFDPWNFARNTVSAQNSIRIIENQLQNYAMQKYGIDINLQNLSQSEINTLMYQVGRQNSPQLNNDIAYYRDLQAFNQQLGVTNQSVMSQYQAYNASKLTPQQYIQQEQQMANSNAGYAASGYESAKRNLARTNAMANSVQAAGQSIGHIKGMTGNMDLLNTQVNTLTQQNEALIKLTAETQMQASHAAIEKAKKAKAAAQAANNLNQAFSGVQNPGQAGRGASDYLHNMLNNMSKPTGGTP